MPAFWDVLLHIRCQFIRETGEPGVDLKNNIYAMFKQGKYPDKISQFIRERHITKFAGNKPGAIPS